MTLPRPKTAEPDSTPHRPYRIAVWGPGEIGGAVIRAAADSAFEVVGALVHRREATHLARRGDDVGPHYRHDDRVRLS